MKRVHIISMGNSYMRDLAVALRKKGYEVSGSDAYIEDVKTESDEVNCKSLSQSSLDSLHKGIDCVVLAADVLQDHPERLRAKELELLILPFSEFIVRQIDDKTRVMVAGYRGNNAILTTMIHGLMKNNISIDYVSLLPMDGISKRISLSYNARIVLFCGDDWSDSSRKPETGIFNDYHPHILLLPACSPEDQESASFKEYLAWIKKMISFIKRDGKLIYNGDDKILCEMALEVREDITAIPFYKANAEKGSNGLEIKTKTANFPIRITEEMSLYNLNAMRVACRQIGLKESDFYSFISEYSLTNSF